MHEKKEIVVLILVVLYVMSQRGMTALIFASDNNRVDPIKALLAVGADMEAKISADSVRSPGWAGWVRSPGWAG